MTEASALVECRRLSGGRFAPAGVRVIVERELHIQVNGRPLVTASITPGLEKEFVAGYLYGQGFIDHLEDIESIDLDGAAAKVTLAGAGRFLEAGTSYRIVSGGGRAAFSGDMRLPLVTSGLKVLPADLFRAMNALFEQASLYGETEGTHAAGIFTPSGSPIVIVEDIGRHNTLDKAIGRALLEKIDCPRVVLACTGRLSSEMVAKVCRAGIPVAATKTAVTDLGLELGRGCGLTIVGFVRDTGTRIQTDMETRTIAEPLMKVYTGPERIQRR